LAALIRFFSDEGHLAQLLDVIQPSSASKRTVSIRLVDWFVTSRCKRTPLVLSAVREDDTVGAAVGTPDDAGGGGSGVPVYVSYAAQLKSYSKALFDPFRRQAKITLMCGSGQGATAVSTTIGQLNYFRWAIESGVLRYVRANLAQLTQECAAEVAEAAEAAKAAAAADRQGTPSRVVAPRSRNVSSSRRRRIMPEQQGQQQQQQQQQLQSASSNSDDDKITSTSTASDSSSCCCCCEDSGIGKGSDDPLEPAVPAQRRLVRFD
jgi:hypothetical protein